MKILRYFLPILILVLAVPTQFAFAYGGGNGGGNGNGDQASTERDDPMNPPAGFEKPESQVGTKELEKIVESQTPASDRDKGQEEGREEDLSELIELVMTLIALSGKDTDGADTQQTVQSDTSKLESDDSKMKDLISEIIAQSTTQRTDEGSGTFTQLRLSPDQIPIAVAGTVPTLTPSPTPTSEDSKPSQQGRELTPEEKAELKLYQNFVNQNRLGLTEAEIFPPSFRME